jgi:hypothetical protein
VGGSGKSGGASATPFAAVVAQVIDPAYSAQLGKYATGNPSQVTAAPPAATPTQAVAPLTAAVGASGGSTTLGGSSGGQLLGY